MNSEKQSTNLQMTLREVNRVGERQKNVPKIRFKGYEDAWEQRKLGEVAPVRGGFAFKSELFRIEGVPIVRISNIMSNGTVGGDFVFYDEQTPEENILLQNGSIVIAMSGATTGKVAKLSLEPDKKLYQNQRVGYFLPTNAVDYNFIFSLVNSNRFKTQLNGIIIAGAQPNISSKDIETFTFSFPALVKEQGSIGLFLIEVDNLITLHQRKYDALKTMKKTLLSKMFPKDGEDVPEIRFKGFTDAWEQRRLEEIFLKIRNAFVGTSTPYYVEKNQGGHFYIESNNVKHGQINHDTEVFINEEFYQNQKDKWLKTGDIVMVQSGHVGHSAVIPEYLNNSAAHALIMFQEYLIETNPNFINFQFQTESVRNKIDSITTGNTIKHILASDMKLFSISNTQKKEADKLGDFFISLDNLITLHQRKLDELKNMKKTLLQQMFV